MGDRFVVTGSGRCGTRYLADLLTVAGVPCGHERAHNASTRGRWPAGSATLQADSSWMAATMLESVDEPVVLLVRHPLAVVRSWVEIGFFGRDSSNPTHGPLKAHAPEVYDWPAPPDRALAMWVQLTLAALTRAELVLRLERLDADQLGRLLRWCGADPAAAPSAFDRVQRCNRHEGPRAATGIRHEPTWAVHDGDLATEARDLAAALGYDPEVIPGG